MLFWAKHIQDAGERRLVEPVRGLLSLLLLGELDTYGAPTFSLWMQSISDISPRSLSPKLIDCRYRTGTPPFRLLCIWISRICSACS